MPPKVRGRLLPHVVALACIGLAPVTARAQDVPIQLPGAGDQSLEDLTQEDQFPLQITGFGVGDFGLDQGTGDNTFKAGKLALAMFREISDRVWIFGQLTTALALEEEEDTAAAAAGPEEVPTEIEIDNLLINLTPGGSSGLSLAFGKFDVPVGFERDDEPLNFQASESFNFELARPAKMVGLIGRWSATPKVDVTAMLGNGWNAQVDPNKQKTAGLRLGLLPTEGTSLGLSGMIGGEGEPGEVHQRLLLSADYALEPTRGLIIAGEGNYGTEEEAALSGGDATWYGGTLTVFRRLGDRLGATLRGEVFRDEDGARTEDVQTLHSLTFSPIYFVGSGREGIFANVEHTTFRIPRFQVRAEVRYDHSSDQVFETETGTRNWGLTYTLQLVTTF